MRREGGGRDETSPPKTIPASGRGRCRPCHSPPRDREGASLSDAAAGALNRRRFPPGGVVDLYARLLGQLLSERLGQPFIIENRVGAGGNIDTEAVIRAPADGYTLLSGPA